MTVNVDGWQRIIITVLCAHALLGTWMLGARMEGQVDCTGGLGSLVA